MTLPLVLFLTPTVAPVMLTMKVQFELGGMLNAVMLTPFAPGLAVNAAPLTVTQVPPTPFGVATTRPAGNVSAKVTFTKLTVVAELVKVNVSEVLPPSGMVAAPKTLATPGGAMTSSVSVLLGAPGPLSLAEMGPVVLLLTPTVVPLRFTRMEQVGLAAGSVPPVKVIVAEPAVAVTVPPQLLLRPLGVATTRPAGRLSVKAIPVRFTLAFELVRVKPTAAVPFSATAFTPKNDLLMVGGAATVNVADAVPPVPPFVELTGPVVFVYTPPTALVTLAVTVHELFTGMLPPVRETLADPAVAVAVPPQVLLSPLGVATTRLAGKVSVKATPFSATPFAAGLVMVTVKLLVPFNGMPVGLKAFAMAGGAKTSMLADAVRPVPPSTDVIVPVVLFFVPAAVPVTFTANVQLPLAARLAPVRLIAFVPCVAVMVPLHVVVRPLGVEIIKPAGRVSLKPMPDNE